MALEASTSSGGRCDRKDTSVSSSLSREEPDLEVISINEAEEGEGEEEEEEVDDEDDDDDLEDDDDDLEYDYEETVARQQEEHRIARSSAVLAAVTAAAAGEGGAADLDDLDIVDILSQESHSDYEDTDGQEGDSVQGKNLAKDDAGAFREASDGMLAKVEAVSSHLIRLWICVKPWRLYEGLGSRTVEALGLDPKKGVVVMLTTDQYYTLSSKCPEVKWVLQMDPNKMDKDLMHFHESIGETFPLQWMLRKRLEDKLAQIWSGRFSADRQGDAQRLDEEEHFDLQGHQAEAARVWGGAGTEPEAGEQEGTAAAESAIKMICECTGATEELATYALKVSHFDEQLAQLNLLEKDMRTALEMTLLQDRETSLRGLQMTFPLAEEAVLLRAIAAHPGNSGLQENYVCRVEAREGRRTTSAAVTTTSSFLPTVSTPPLPDHRLPAAPTAAPTPAVGATGTVLGRTAASAVAAVAAATKNRPQRWGKRKSTDTARAETGSPSPFWSKPNTKAKPTRNDSSDCGGGSGSGGGGRGQHPGWEWGAAGEGAAGGVEFMPVDLTEDEEREDRRALLEHLAEKNLLLRVAHFTIEKLRNANKRCLVCDGRIEGYLPAVPIVCPKELCVMSSQDMGCGTDVESQVMGKGETVDLLIDLFWMAMNLDGKRSELGFPDSVYYGEGLAFKDERGKNDVAKVRRVLSLLPTVSDMQQCIKRNRGKCGGVAMDYPTAPSCGDGLISFANDDRAVKLNAIASNTAQTAANAAANAAALANLNPRNPGVVAAKAAADAAATAAANAAATAAAHVAAADPGSGLVADDTVLSFREALSERDPLSYPLLRWLLSANRAHLRPLRGHEIIPEVPCEKQFMLVTGTAEREAKFQTMKRSAVSKGRGSGSFYAFHGSGPGNWHSILHTGLKNMSGSSFMSSGAAYGSGIYMAEKLGVSLSYARGGFHWPLSTVKESGGIVAVCEVIDREDCRRQYGPSYFVVPDEECVATRYLLINPKSVKHSTVMASDLTINNRRLC